MVARLGEAARYNQAEKAALVYGMTQMFENASVHVVAGAMSLLWPGALLVGSALYASRIWTLYQAQHAPPAVGAPPRANDHERGDETWLRNNVTQAQRGVL